MPPPLLDSRTTPSRVTLPRSPISGSCTTTARACPRTPPRRGGGSASSPSRVTPTRSSTSGHVQQRRWRAQGRRRGGAVVPPRRRAGRRLRAVQSRGHVRQRRVPEDDFEAVRWYRLAAEQGYADAQFNKYDNGEGVPKDDARLWSPPSLPRRVTRRAVQSRAVFARRGLARGRRNRVRLAQHRCRAGPSRTLTKARNMSPNT